MLVRYITNIPTAIPDMIEALERRFSFSCWSHFIKVSVT